MLSFSAFRKWVSSGTMTTRAGTGAGFQTSFGISSTTSRARSCMFMPPTLRLQAVLDGRLHPQFLAGFGIPALDQIPGRIQRTLIIGQANPERRQSTQTPPRATISAAHFHEFLDPRLGEGGGQVVGPVRSKWAFPPASAGSFPLQESRGRTCPAR